MIQYIISLCVAPHGITDIILAYETNTIPMLVYIYSLLPIVLFCIHKSLHIYIFMISSLIHFRHDLPCIPCIITLFYYVNELSMTTSLNYITYYLAGIHTPLHYYRIFSSTKYVYEHIYMIYIMTFISLCLTPYILHNMIDRYVIRILLMSIILSHIALNEYIGYMALS
jgi:hypothetical protein